MNPYFNVIADFFFQSLPEDSTVTGCGHIGEDSVLEDSSHSIRVGSAIGSGCHAEESIFWIYSTESAFLVEFHPSDIISHALDFVPW